MIRALARLSNAQTQTPRYRRCHRYYYHSRTPVSSSDLILSRARPVASVRAVSSLRAVSACEFEREFELDFELERDSLPFLATLVSSNEVPGEAAREAV